MAPDTKILPSRTGDRETKTTAWRLVGEANGARKTIFKKYGGEPR